MLTNPAHRAELFLPSADDPRANRPTPTDERDTLTHYLQTQRLTLELKCAGLTPEQLAHRSVEPSTLSLLGLLRHMAKVEHAWFRRVMSDHLDLPKLYVSPESPDADFDDAAADPELVEQAWRSWRTECAFADDLIARTPDLSTPGNHDGTPITLRQVLVHMIEEYARHNGHADLLRERIDGRVGV